MEEIKYADPMGYVKSFDKESDELVVIGIPFTSPVNNNLDLHEQYFDKDTDLGVLDEATVYFSHNKWSPLNKSAKEVARAERLLKAYRGKALGKARKSEVTEEGVLYNIVLDKRIPYINAIEEMIADGLLDISSGAKYGEMDGEKEGRISKWHTVELSLTPTPSNPNAIILSKSILEKALEELEDMPDQNATDVAEDNTVASGLGEATPTPADALMKSLEAVLAKSSETPAITNQDALLEKSVALQTDVSELRNQVIALTELVKSLHTALPYMAEQIVNRIDNTKSMSSFDKQAPVANTPPRVATQNNVGKGIFGANGPKVPNLRAIGE